MQRKNKLGKVINSFFEKRNLNRMMMVLFSTYFLFASFFVITTGTFFYDEAWTANIGYHISNGYVLYRDISASYGPIVFYIYSFIISIFGKQFFFFRVVGLFIIILQSYYSSKIVGLFTKNKATILLTAFFALLHLGFYQSGRVTASTTAGLFSLMIAFYHLSYLKTKDRKNIITVGVLFALLALTKHNVFALDLAANAVFMVIVYFYMFKKERKIDYEYFFLPLISFLSIILTYLVIIFPYIYDFYKNIVLQISQYASSDAVIPFPMPFDLFNMDFKELILTSLFLYSIFPLLIVFGIILYRSNIAWKSQNYGIILIALLAAFHFIEIYPLSDYSHYARATILFSPFLGLLLFFAYRSKNKLTMVFLASGLFLHFYIAPLNIYLNLKEYFSKPPSSIEYARYIKKIYEEEKLINILSEIESLGESKFMLIGHGSWLYYLSNNFSLSKYNTVTYFYLDEMDEKKVITEIENNGIEYLIEASTIREDNDLDELIILGSFVRNNYTVFKRIEGYTLWKKN